MKIAVIIPAAGLGKRFGSTAQKSKIEMDLAGKPVFLRSIELFLDRPDVCQIILAVHPDQLEAFKFRHGDKLAFHNITIIPGGTAERWQTIQIALSHVTANATHIAVHDAARPLASASMIDRVFQAATHFDAVIPALPVTATLKRITAPGSDSGGITGGGGKVDPLDAILGADTTTKKTIRRIVATVDRSDLVEAQTPQVFTRALLTRAYAQNFTDDQPVTDDASLVERLGQPVHVVEGQSLNIKITHRDDLTIACAFLSTHEKEKLTKLGPKRIFADEDD